MSDAINELRAEVPLPQEGFEVVYQRPHSLNDTQFTYCPGCQHGQVHLCIAEAIDELEIKDRMIGMAPVGCSVFAYWFFDFDFISCPHGRAPAVATGIKRADPEAIVLSYQGDGDLASIGAAEIVHAANRGEQITVVFINNAIYGMTGGQMAPTSLEGMVTSTSPRGRDVSIAGKPIHVVEMLSTLSGVAYAERTTAHDPKGLIKTKKAIKKAFEYQMEGLGFTIVEVLCGCAINTRRTPKDSAAWVGEEMNKVFQVGVFKDIKEEG
ncbi:2-oxoglutarate oxidoreductase [bacterium]|nr:2-oxoglutarate oxidoreductase [bacterium]